MAEKVQEPTAELETRAMRLQTLVGELLVKNQKLRDEVEQLKRADRVDPIDA